MKIFEPHPYSKVFRKSNESEFNEIVEDIKVNGQRVKGLIFEGMLLDGNTRQRACIKLGKEFLFKEFPGNKEQALHEVKSLNLCRKHLTDDERACAGAELLKLYPKTNAHTAIKNGLHGRMLPKIAKEMKVSQHKVRDAVFLRNYSPETFEKCKNGELKVGKEARSIYKDLQPDNSSVPNNFSTDIEISDYVKNVCMKGWELSLECIDGKFYSYFWGLNGIHKRSNLKNSYPEFSIKRSVVCAIREYVEKYSFLELKVV